MSHSNQPHDSVIKGLLRMFRNEGWKSWFYGIGPSLLGLSHVAVQFPLYEKIKLLIRGFYNL